MIDNQDKQTQPIDLGPAPKRRGRPAKQNALSNAERQRLYRERQKAQRNEKSESHPVPYEEVVAIAQELGERCKAAEEKVKELEKELRKARTKLLQVKRRYILQWQDPEKGTWHDDSTGDYANKERAHKACKMMNDRRSDIVWRVREREWA